MIGSYRCRKGIHGPPDIPTKFPEETDQTLKYQTCVARCYMFVTRGFKKTPENYSTILEKLQEAKYRMIGKNPNFSQKNNLVRTRNR